MKQKFTLVLIVSVLCFFKSNYSNAQVNMQDSLALVDLYNSTNGQDWNNHTNWLTSAPVSNWFGITVDNNRVTSILLDGNYLSGNIPVSIGNLTNIWDLNMYQNNLTGSIPSSIGKLINLNICALEINKLSGDIPSSFGKLVNLISIELGSNQLTGNISFLSKLTRMSYLSLSGNQLTGNISVLNRLHRLGYVALSFNQFSGKIPVLNNLDSIGYLDLSYNQFNGSIPNFRKSDVLTYLNLSYNFLSGSIRHQFDSLTNAFLDLDISISHNQLAGSLPSFNKLTYLNGLDLSFNNLSGTIPALDSLKNLEYLNLSNNELSGSIPASINALHNLRTINLSNNQLNNRIPDLDNLKNLNIIDFSHNQLSDSIPSTISSLYNLATINLADNHLSGTIPLLRLNDFFQNSIYLDSNQFTFAGTENLVKTYPFAVYSPQANIHLNLNGTKLFVTAGGTLANNTYTWYKNGHLYKTKTGDSTLRISKSASYYVDVTNSIATALTLRSDTINYNEGVNAIASQTNNKNKFSLISLYPNPAKTNATFSFNATGKYAITIADVLGKILQTKSGISNRNVNIIKLDVNKYAGGIYLITISDEKSQKQTIRLNKE